MDGGFINFFDFRRAAANVINGSRYGRLFFIIFFIGIVNIIIYFG